MSNQVFPLQELKDTEAGDVVDEKKKSEASEKNQTQESEGNQLQESEGNQTQESEGNQLQESENKQSEVPEDKAVLNAAADDFQSAALASASKASVWWRDLEHQEEGGTGVRAARNSDVEYHLGRGHWANKAEFVLSCMGMSVGLGNVWRFPYLAYENGGAAFLVAYVVLQFLVGKPMYFMELAVTQFCGKGPTKMWDMNPAAKGVGLAMCVVSINIAIYYNVIMCYTLYYFFASMQRTLPWTMCKEDWVKEDNCVAERFPECTTDATVNEKLGTCTCTGNATFDETMSQKCVERIANPKTAAELYFYKSVIQLSPGIEPENIGTPIPMLAMYLLLSWTVVVFCLIKGIKSSGKVVYFTATFPYVILIALLFRVSLLDGAKDGAKYFLVPVWSKLKDLNMWASAAGQMFFSLGVTFGGIIMFGSYNRFDNPVYRDALIVASMDLVTSVLGSLVVFTTFGVVAKQIGSTVDKVAKSGYGLAFVVYPEALSWMPPSHLWSVLFFFMLFTLGLDSEFGFMETVLTCIQDEFPKLRKHKSIICVLMCAACYLIALPCVCPGGDYVVTLMDHYGADFAVLILAFFEVVGIMWGYGVRNVLSDLEYMVGARPRAWQYWAFCWVLMCPGIIACLFSYRMFNYKPPRYGSGQPFPQFAQNIGWTICSVALCPIPLWFFYLVFQAWRNPETNTWELRKKFLFYPNRHWIPNDGRSVVGSQTDLA